MSNAIPPTITFQSLARSGVIPPTQRGAMQAAYNRLIGDGADSSRQSVTARAEVHAVAAFEGIRQTGEAFVFGGMLGAMHASLPGGLDVKMPGTKTVIPVDGVGALLGLIGGSAAATSPHGIGKTIASGGAACMAIFAFRKSHDLLKAMKSGATSGGGAAVNGLIGKSQFAGEDGWAPGSNVPKESSSWFGGESEDPIVRLGKSL